MSDLTEYKDYLVDLLKTHLAQEVSQEGLLDAASQICEELVNEEEIDEDYKNNLSEACIEAIERITEDNYANRNEVISAFETQLQEILESYSNQESPGF